MTQTINPPPDPGMNMNMGTGMNTGTGMGQGRRSPSLPPLLAELSRTPERAPGPAAAVLSGALAAGLGLGALVAVALVLWICSPYPDGGLDGALHGAAALWLLSHGTELIRTNTLSGGNAPVGVTPLLLLALLGWLAHRAGHDAASPQSGGADEERNGAGTSAWRPGEWPSAWGALCGVALGYLLVATAVAAYADGGGLRPVWTSAAVRLPLLVVAATAAGVWRARGPLRARRPSPRRPVRGRGHRRRRAVPDPWHRAVSATPRRERAAADRTDAAADRTGLGAAGTGPAKVYGAAMDRAAADRAAMDRVATDRAAADRVATDRAAADRVATEHAAADRVGADRVGACGVHPDAAVAASPWGRPIHAVLRAAGSAALVLFVGGALLALLALVRHETAARTWFLRLAQDGTGRVAVLLLVLAVLPNVAVWAASFALGPGFLLGAGHAVVPLGLAQVPPLPGVSALAVLPAQGSGAPASWAAGAVPLVAGLTLAWRTVQATAPAYGERDQAWGWVRTVLAAMGAAVLCGLAVAGLCVLAGGPMGVAGLARFGPVWWQAGAAAAGWTLVVGVPSVVVLRAVRVRGLTAGQVRIRCPAGRGVPRGAAGRRSAWRRW